MVGRPAGGRILIGWPPERRREAGWPAGVITDWWVQTGWLAQRRTETVWPAGGGCSLAGRLNSGGRLTGRREGLAGWLNGRGKRAGRRGKTGWLAEQRREAGWPAGDGCRLAGRLNGGGRLAGWRRAGEICGAVLARGPAVRFRLTDTESPILGRTDARTYTQLSQ